MTIAGFTPSRHSPALDSAAARWAVSGLFLATAMFVNPARSAVSPLTVESVTTTDLDIDPSFGGNDTGAAIFDFNAGDTRHDEGLRSFLRCEGTTGDPCTRPFYYVVGRRANAFGWDAIVAKADAFGNPDFGFGIQGRLVVATPLIDISDVAFDPVRGRLYFAGGGYSSVFPREGFAVFCVDILSGAACADWNYRFMAFAISNHGVIDSVASKIALDASGYLFLGGNVQADDGFQLGVAKMDTADGSPVIAFGNTGRATYALQYPGVPTPPVQDARVLDIALSESSAPQGSGLYVVGSNALPMSPSRGYLVSIDPQTGAYLRGVDGFGSAVSAMTVLADGNIAMAGYAQSGMPGAPSLMLAKVRAADASLQRDPRFCVGGLCVRDVGAGIHGWQDTLPTSIAERPGDHDLVVAMQAKVWTYDFATDIWHLSAKQLVQQFGSNGTILHATQQMDFPASADDTPAAYSSAMIVEKGSLLLTGTRLWAVSTDDYDVTVTRLLANDAIFGDGFDEADAR